MGLAGARFDANLEMELEKGENKGKVAVATQTGPFLFRKLTIDFTTCAAKYQQLHLSVGTTLHLTGRTLAGLKPRPEAAPLAKRFIIANNGALN